MNNSAQVTAQSSRRAQARERLAIQRMGRGKPAPIGHSAIKPALVRALTTGGGTRTGLLSINWDIAGTGVRRCLDPQSRTVEATQGLDSSKLLSEAVRPRSWLDMKMRCRKCANCLQLRALDWTNRAKREIECAQRSWFGTMTLKPSQQLRAEQFARVAVGRRGDDFDAMSEAEQFAERHRVISRWITLWVKRIRIGRPRLRLMVVCEKHKSGLPHYHALIHEEVAFATGERQLRGQWFYGFSKFVVVKQEEGGKAAWYVAKYLCKATECRVRASVAYGEPTLSAKPSLDWSVNQDQERPPPQERTAGQADQGVLPTERVPS